MEKVINNDLTRILIIFLGGSVALYMLMAQKVGKLKGSFKAYKKATLWYLLAALLLFAAIACLASMSTMFSSPGRYFVIFQAYFLLLGIWHVAAMKQNLEWSNDEKAFRLRFLFTVLVSVFGCMGFLLLYRYLNKDGLHNIMATSILFFLVPFLIQHTFKKAADIPPVALRQWYYPIREEIEEPDEDQLKNLLVIAFQFRKQTGDQHYTNFRAKAPKDMELGRLFYYFINDYNERHADSRIEFLDPGGEPYGWVFYKRAKWYMLTPRYIDPEKSAFANGIRENDVIICSRLLVEKPVTRRMKVKANAVANQ